MYFVSLIRDGPRGLEGVAQEEDIGDIAEYGIDWAAADDPRIMDHLLEREADAWDSENPFAAPPKQRPHVPCDGPGDFFSPWEVQELTMRLHQTLGGLLATRNMEVRRQIWIVAFEICGDIIAKRMQM